MIIAGLSEKMSEFLIKQYNATGDYRFEDASKLVDDQAARITELQAQLADAKKDAERYLKLRRMAVELSLSHQVISQFVTNQGELDSAIAAGNA